MASSDSLYYPVFAHLHVTFEPVEVIVWLLTYNRAVEMLGYKWRVLQNKNRKAKCHVSLRQFLQNFVFMLKYWLGLKKSF